MYDKYSQNNFKPYCKLYLLDSVQNFQINRIYIEKKILIDSYGALVFKKYHRFGYLVTTECKKRKNNKKQLNFCLCSYCLPSNIGQQSCKRLLKWVIIFFLKKKLSTYEEQVKSYSQNRIYQNYFGANFFKKCLIVILIIVFETHSIRNAP